MAVDFGVDRMLDLFEGRYQRIGWHRGQFATPDARREVQRFWIEQGVIGAAWLVARIADETHESILQGVANLLADIGQASIGPILYTLGGDPGRDRAVVLLKALGWIGKGRHADGVDRLTIEDILGRYLADSDPDIREATCIATAILPSDSAISLLRHRRGIETGREVLAAIDEGLGLPERREKSRGTGANRDPFEVRGEGR